MDRSGKPKKDSEGRPEIKITVTNNNASLGVIKNGVDTIKERVSELEEVSIETSKTNVKRKENEKDRVEYPGM